MATYRHGLRASKLIALRCDQIDLKAGTIHVSRLKHGSPSSHPLHSPELRALRVWKREQPDTAPLYLGHKNIQHTVRYTELSPGAAQGFQEGLSATCARASVPFCQLRSGYSAGDSFAGERAKSLRCCRAGLLLKRGQPRAERINLALLRRYLSGLFLQFVKQQGSELQIAHAFDFAVGPADHQFGIYPRHLLRYQAVLQCSAGVVLITEAHWPLLLTMTSAPVTVVALMPAM